MKKKLYELLVCVLAVISVIFVIVDLNGKMTDLMRNIDSIIYAFFVVDYFTRFFISKDKKKFVKTNLLDLIAILPFSSALRIFRTLKFVKLIRIAKIAKLAKLVALSGRFLHKSKAFLDTNGFKYILLLSGIMIVAGGFLISFAEGMTISDGIWWAFVTSTTVGYGDISPGTTFGRIIACALMICGIGLIGSLTSTITSFFIESKNNQNELPSSDRVDMALKLYEELNESEKEIFKNKI